MSNWLSKSDSSIQAAENLCKDFSNQSIHCAYYSCVQLLYHIMNTELAEPEEDLNDGDTKRRFEDSMPKREDGQPNRLGTHVWLQRELFRSLVSRKADPDEITFIVECLGTISGVRIEADYKSTLIPSQRAVGIHKKAVKLLEKLKTIY